MESGDGASGSLPFALSRRCGLLISTQPPLTRTLGPVLHVPPGKPATDLRRRLRLTEALIAQLPAVHFFHQTFDPRITDGLAFALHDYTIRTAYTFRLAPDGAPATLWKGMTDKNRNLIRRAEERLTVAELHDADAFCTFYDANLPAGRTNMYGSATMRRVVRAFLAHDAGTLLSAWTAGGDMVAAIAVVHDPGTDYFLLSTRHRDAHSGAVALLLWHAIRDAAAGLRVFDFDGIASEKLLQFLSGFGGALVPRLVVERASVLYDTARLLRRTLRRKDAPARLA